MRSFAPAIKKRPAKKRNSYTCSSPGKRYTSPREQKRQRLHFSKLPKSVFSKAKAPAASIPTYAPKGNHGNGSCDGFSPNFPLIRKNAEPLSTRYFVLPLKYTTPASACQQKNRYENLIPAFHGLYAYPRVISRAGACSRRNVWGGYGILPYGQKGKPYTVGANCVRPFGVSSLLPFPATLCPRRPFPDAPGGASLHFKYSFCLISDMRVRFNVICYSPINLRSKYHCEAI